MNIRQLEIQLKKTRKEFSITDKKIELAISQKHRLDDGWDKHCFLPHKLWEAFNVNYNSDGSMKYKSDEHPENILAKISSLMTWQYSKGVYEFDDELSDELMKTEVKDIPSLTLRRLPEWCIFVKSPKNSRLESHCDGFFAQINTTYNVENTRHELLITTVKDDTYYSIPIMLGAKDINDSLDEHMATAFIGRNESNKSIVKMRNLLIKETLSEILTDTLKLLIYICSDNIDLINEKHPKKQLAPYKKPLPRNKSKFKLRQASRAVNWKVGQNIGDSIRSHKYNNRQQNGKKTVRPHFRRGHYRMCWRGKHNTPEREAVPVFILPTFVNGSSPKEPKVS